MANEVKIGSVVHYYPKISVVIIELTEGLRLGDKIHFIRGGEDLFGQEVTSMQVNHKPVDMAGSGDEVGLKTGQEIKNGAEVYKIT